MEGNREDWQQYSTERREDWQQYADDHWEEHGHGYYGGGYYYDEYYEPDWGLYAAGAVTGLVVGVAISADSYQKAPCESAMVMVEQGTYYHCGSTWYQRAYKGDELVYVVVDPPPGH